MKILRLGLSDDNFGELPKESRSWHIAQTLLEESTGEPWETAFGPSWPWATWTEQVEAAVEEHEPDLVMICCAAYWVSYPSAPLKARRSRLPLGRRLGNLATKVAAKPIVADRKLFHLTRRAIVGSGGGSFYREPESAAKSVESVVRAVLQREELAVAVRGPLPLRINGNDALRALCESRRTAFDAGLAGLCRQLHVEYLPFGPEDIHPPEELAGDRVHVNEAGHLRRAEGEFDVMDRAWKAHTDSGNQ